MESSTKRGGGRMKIYHDLMNQSKLISVQNPQTLKELRLSGRAADPSGRSPTGPTNQHGGQPSPRFGTLQPPAIHINTNLKANRPTAREGGLQIHGKVSKEQRNGAGGQIRIVESTDLLPVPEVEADPKDSTRWTRRHRSLHAVAGRGGNSTTDVTNPGGKQGTGTLNRMGRNMEQLTNMKLVGGSTRLSQLIELMHNQGQKQQRLQNIEMSRAENTGFRAAGHQTERNRPGRLGGSVIDGARAGAAQTVNARDLQDQIEDTQPKSNIHVVISVGKDGQSPEREEKEDGNPIDATNQSDQFAARKEPKVGFKQSKQFQRLRNVDSVQLLGKAQEGTSLEGDDEGGHYQSGDTKPPSMMTMSRGNKQALEDYTQKYQYRVAGKPFPSPVPSSGLQQMPHTTKHLKGAKLKVGFTSPGDGDALSNDKLNTDHSTVHSNNILMKQGIGYSSLDKSLVRLPHISGSGQTTSPLTSNMGHQFARPSGSKRTADSLSTRSQDGLNEGDQAGPQTAGGDRNSLIQEQNEAGFGSNAAKKRERSYRKAMSYQNYADLGRHSKVQDSSRTLNAGETAARGVVEMVNKLQRDQTLLYGDSPEEQQLNFDRYSQFKVKKMKFGKDGAQNKINLTRGVPSQAQAQANASTSVPQKLLNSKEKELNNIKSIQSVLLKGKASTHDTTNQVSTRMLSVSPSSNIMNIKSPSMQSVRDHAITPFASKGSMASPAAISYNMLSNDKERTNQLLEVFNRKLRSLGYQKEQYSNIIKQAGMQLSENQSALGLAGIEGEVQSFQAMLAAQEMGGRPGGHAQVRKTASTRSPLSSGRNVLQSLSESAHRIAEAHQKASQEVLKNREETRSKIDANNKKKKAVGMLGQVERKVKEAKGAFAADLSVDDRKIKVGLESSGADEGQPGEDDQKSQAKRPRKFADHYNFEQYEDKTVDSDLAEQEAFSAIDVEEYQLAQQNLTEKEENRLRLPLIEPKKHSVQDDVQSKRSSLHTEPQAHQSDVMKTIAERRTQVDERLRDKQKFRADLESIAEDAHLVRDVIRLETGMNTQAAQINTRRITATLSRKHANQLYKDDFEYKISQMNQRMQPEFEDTQKKVTLSQQVLGPFPTAKGMLEEVRKKEELRQQKLMQKHKKRWAQTESGGDFQNQPAPHGSTAKRGAETGRFDDIEEEHIDGSYLEEGEGSQSSRARQQVEAAFKAQGTREQADNSPSTSPEKPRQMMSEYKKRQRRKLEAEQIRSVEKAREAQISKDDFASWLRVSAVREKESEYEDDRSTPDNYQEMKKRERMKEFHEIRKMPRSRRRERLMERNMYATEEDPVEEKVAEKWHNFVNKISKEGAYPANIIQKLVVKNMLEIESKTDEEKSTQEISRQFAQNDIINGLCLLYCLKNNVVGEDVFNSEQSSQAAKNSKNIMKAANLVKEFQAGAKLDEEHEDPQLRLGRFLARKASAKGSSPYRGRTGTSSGRSEYTNSPRSRAGRGDSGSPRQEGDATPENQRRIFNTQVFNKVIQEIVGFKFKEPDFRRQLVQKLSTQLAAELDKPDGTEDENRRNAMVFKELKRQEQEIMGKFLETDDAKALDVLKRDLQKVKAKLKVEIERQKKKATTSMVEQAKMNRKEPSMQVFARGVNLQDQFYQVCKYAENPKVKEQMNANPVMLYYQSCQKEGSVSLPIPVLKRIHNKTLTLINYSLTNGVCSALGKAFQGNPQLFHSIILDSNGCKDDDFIDLLKGMHKLDHVRAITYKRNDFIKTQTVENIIPLLVRRKPTNLEELKIINCRIGGAVTHRLIDALLKQSSLKRLSLVKANLTPASFNELLKFLAESRTLQHLDLSCNSLRHEQMFLLLEILSQDRKLLSVDLSWNTIMDTEASHLKSTLDYEKSYQPVTKLVKKQRQAAERTVGQFSHLSQTIIFQEKWEEERQKEIQQLGEETYSLITGTNLRTAENAAIETEQIDGGELNGEGMEEGTGDEDMAGEMEEGEPGEGQEAEEAASAKGDADGDVSAGPQKEEKKKNKYEEPKKLGEAAKAAKKRRLLLAKMLKALRKNLVSFIKYNQVLQHFNLNNTGLTEEIIRQVGISLNKSRGLVAIHLSGNPGITDRQKDFLRTRIKCKSLEPAFKVEFDLEKFEKRGAIPKTSPRDIHERNALLGTEGKKQLVEENLKLQHIKKTAMINDAAVKFESGDGHRLDFIRIVGHQCDMPGSQQWAMLEDGQDAMQNCWVCDQQIHSLIFWTQSIGDRSSVLQTPRELPHKEAIARQIVQKYQKLDPINIVDSADRVEQRLARLYTFIKEDVDRPLICCEYTNWKPVRMLRIDEYCASLESSGARQGVDIYDKLIQQGSIAPGHKETKRYDLLDEAEKEAYLSYRSRTMDQYQRTWHDTLADEIRYKKPFMANGELLAEIDHPDEEQLYVFPCFLKPGRQNYVVVQEDDIACNTVEAVDMPRDVDNYYVHKCIVESRQEDIALWSKPLRGGEKTREFRHATSVFGSWKPDNKATLAKCLEHDFALWKLPRFCKDPDEQERVMDKVKEYFPLIKEVYHCLISKSNYPYILYQDFFDWSKQVKIFDGGVIDEKRVTLSFEAANYVVEPQPGIANPENALCRFEFLEILVRLAKDKYITFDKKTDKLSEAFEMLVKQCLIANEVSDPWSGFRTNELWTLPVNDLLEPNKTALNNLYESYFTPRKRFMDLADCQDLFYKRTGILKQDKHVEYCFGMSHMTIAQECREAQKFDQLSFAEFLELCGRVAQYRFKDEPNLSQLDLVPKLEYVLDEVLAVLEVKRLDPVVVHQDISESDEDY